MWIIEGLFGQDQDPASSSAELRQKLLKPGNTYGLGRRDKPLIIANKKISTEHCVFTVGAFSTEDVVNPDKRPSLHIFNPRVNKSLTIYRNGEQMILNGTSTEVLQPTDRVALAGDFFVTVFWRVCCYIQRPVPSTIDACATLGISIAQNLHPFVDYHILSLFSVSPTIGISLVLQSNFVKSEWLDNLIEICSDPEKSYTLPPLSKYRPGFSTTLIAPYKKFSIWEPDENRRELLGDFYFLCVSEKEREIDSTLRMLIETGSGRVGTFNLDGKMKWTQALTRGLAKEKTLVLIGDQSSITAAVGENVWKDMDEEALKCKKRFFTPTDIVRAILDVDTTTFRAEREDSSLEQDSGHPASSPLPDCVPNSIPEEMTLPPAEADEEPPVTRRRTRATSRQPSQERTSQVEPEEPPRRRPLVRRVKPGPPPEEPAEQAPEIQVEDGPSRPRRPLTRRVKSSTPAVTDLDNSVVTDDPAAADPPEPAAPVAPMILDLTAPPPARSSRLKRRRADSQSNEIIRTTSEPPEEPSLKKFRALFEATNDPEQADALMSQLPESDLPASTSQTQTQSGTLGTRRTVATRQTLATVPEDTQEPHTMNANAASQKKRKAVSDDEDMAGVEEVLAPTAPRSRASSAVPPSKKRAVENVNAVESSSERSPKKGGKASGAPPGKPDTDPVFLKAVASTKRGKKAEDDFDREFNKLKISKPELDQVKADPEDQWAILGDFGNETTNIRGNFMVVVEMDVYRDRLPQARSASVNPEWEGRPNFKKFKQKNIRPRSQRIQLMVSDNNEYSLGTDGWKGDLSNADDTMSQNLTQNHRPSHSHGRALLDDDSDEEFPTKTHKQGSRAAAANTKKPPAGRGKKAPVKSQPLFLDDDEDEDVIKPETFDDFSDIEEMAQTLPSPAPDKRQPRRAAAGKSKNITPIIVDDDSDEDAFKGFKGRKRR